MNIKKSTATLILLLSLFIVNAQPPSPGTHPEGPVLIVGGIAHLGNGDKIVDAAIGFDKGKITFVGYASKVDQSAYKTVINAEGKEIYPAFIAPNSTLGLMEIGAVRATRDYNEVGEFIPNVRSLIAYSTDSDITPTIRSNGVLYGQITPRGGRISGSSAIVNFDAWNWEDAVLVEADGVHMNWPRLYRKHWSGSDKHGIELMKNYEDQKAEIRDFFNKAKA